MQPLEPPDTHYLSAAAGWYELGDVHEARAELAQISRAGQKHPDVLEFRWLVLAKEEHWSEGLAIARQLIHAAPERVTGWLHQAYALRRAPGGGLQKAWEALRPAADQFPEETTVVYNLACYACQMGHLEEARLWFARAQRIGGAENTRKMALADPDLEPLWKEIRNA